MDIASTIGTSLFALCSPSLGVLAFVAFVATFLGLGVVEIVVGHAELGGCDNLNPTFNLTVGQWLIGLGVYTLIKMIYILFVKKTKKNNGFIEIVCVIFSILWLFIGGIVIFASNTSCIKSGEVTVCQLATCVPNGTTVKYGLAMWCVELMFFLLGFYSMIDKLYINVERKSPKKTSQKKQKVSA